MTNEILQGTTPAIRIRIDPRYFKVDRVTQLEWVFYHDDKMLHKNLSDVIVDTPRNSFIYRFTQEETLALNTNRLLQFQLRFMFQDNQVLGTKQMSLGVADLYSKDVMVNDV